MTAPSSAPNGRTHRVIRASWEKLMITPELVSNAEDLAGLLCNLRHLAKHERWNWENALIQAGNYFDQEDRS